MFSSATKNAANDTIADAKTASYSAAHDLHDGADGISSEFADYAQKAGRNVRNFIDDTSHKITHAGDRVSNEIRNNPIRSSAIALGVGVVLGVLLRR